MSDLSLRLLSPRPAPAADLPRRPLGRLLVESGAISRDRLVQALRLQLQQRAPIGEILVAEGWAGETAVQTALAAQYGLQQVDLAQQPPDPGLGGTMPWQFWLRHRAIPWQRLGPILLIATARPDRFDRLRAELPDTGATAVPVLANGMDIDAAIAGLHGASMSAAASTRVAPRYSCRNWNARKRLAAAIAVLAALLAMALAPLAGLMLLFGLAILSLALFAGLRLAGFAAHVQSHARLTAPHRPRHAPPARLPRVSVLVPLFREREIAGKLVERLARLTYPKALLDVILVLEQADDVTREALAAARLPAWMRVIEVPADGGLTTKPRAMNYALDFCRGEIVGVWDAEDAPVPDQIEHVVSRFAGAAPEVVCLQGILDYYNPRTNWRTRCFTIEYASWFRIVLHGIARLGLVVPLGGTTLFFRRDKLVELGGWDAHNVTEDADLGVRLVRAGYRTELIDTVTYEEATGRAWPWIRQRSRWLKGFMVTYLVHMRAPRRLWAELGAARFLGVQAFFLGTLGQFLLAPLLWTFWPMAFGIAHPLSGLVPAPMLAATLGLLILAELLSLCIALAAVSASGRRFLLAWIPTMILYFPLGVVAAYKAVFELCFCPFFWDKTPHGQSSPECEAATLSAARACRHPVSDGS
ncbi:MAG: glycosyltransferase [Jhaorihella sp.]